MSRVISLHFTPKVNMKGLWPHERLVDGRIFISTLSQQVLSFVGRKWGLRLTSFTNFAAETCSSFWRGMGTVTTTFKTWKLPWPAEKVWLRMVIDSNNTHSWMHPLVSLVLKHTEVEKYLPLLQTEYYSPRTVELCASFAMFMLALFLISISSLVLPSFFCFPIWIPSVFASSTRVFSGFSPWQWTWLYSGWGWGWVGP